MTNTTIVIAFMFFALAYRALAQQQAANTSRCDIKSQVACNIFLGNQGKICALTPAICYDKDPLINDKKCSTDSTNQCKAFTDSNGYLCSNFYCLITTGES
jgi:hypothetical protein